MRLRTLLRPRTLVLLALAALMGAAVAVLPALAAAPSEVKLEVNENCVQNDWPCWAIPGSGSKPEPASKVTIAAGGEVMFTDNTSTAANIAWTGSAPTCSSGVPVSPTSPQAPWEGKCKFEQPGTYKFESSTLFNGGPSLNYTEYEIVVEGGATGTTPTTTTTTTATPTTTTTTTPTTTSEPSHGSPLEGGSRALKLTGSQRGSTVHGSIKVSQAGSGGRLEVGLFAAGASLAKARHSEQVRVGRLVRSSLKAGSVSFSVPLSAKGKAALRRHRRLALTVKITLTPQHGAAVTITRVVVVHA
jgi:plastocyanin